ncbi:hypothetical protein [Frankia sp. R82]|uniref:hypothetical protein n=1 Tax=Frankia sp. R82 TaxID=2950553 RepID=UPI0020446CE9|nr:hypothetical protein [Frankia sp. R82]MCM3885512.1 hypothetical protein [Frankia sp. R82]
MRRILLALYPRKWRARYGDEFAALLQDTPLTLVAVIDVLRHAAGLRLQARPRLTQVAAWALATAAIEIVALRAGLTDNILWAPTTPLRTLALAAVLTPSALVAGSVARLRIQRRRPEPA